MKQKVCIAGIALGIIMMILGLVVLCGSGRSGNSLLSFSGEVPRDISFGGDFYTYSYDATRAAARNLADLGELVEDAIGVLLLTLGAGGVLLSLYGYAGCRESGAPAHAAASASAPAAPSPVASAAARVKDLLKGIGVANPEWPTQKSSPEPRPERRPVSGAVWTCACGASNPASRGVCPECGALKPNKTPLDYSPPPVKKPTAVIPGSWTCTCGAQWPAHRGTCESCGERKPK